MQALKNWLLLAVLFFCTVLNIKAQAQTITGKIIDKSDGSGLPGVTVLEKGTNNGSVSDQDGNYSISVGANAVLVFSFVGYISQEITVGNQSTIDIQLATDLTQLEEVVVVGYGTQKKEDLTGVVSTISNKDFNRGAIVSSDQLIAGKVAGVQITSNSGEPGGQVSIRIRGGTSVNASNEPLYVIDGVPIDNSAHNPGGFNAGRNPLNFLNPDDIESFTVLKDASATAIYGSRGANGVIIIKTKKGRKGNKGSISYSNWFSFAEPINKVDVLNAEQFRAVVAERAPNRLEILGNTFTDWQGQVTQVAFGQNHSLGFTGGSENMGYRISLGYLDQEGILKNSETQRVSYSMNYTHALLDNDLTIDINVKGALTDDRFSDGGALSNAVGFAPTQPVFDVNSPFGGFWEWPLSFGNAIGVNPVSILEQTQDVGQTFRSIGNIQFDYKLPYVEGLSFKLNLGYDVTRGERSRFLPSTLRSQFAGDRGEVRNENLIRFNQLLDVYVNYKKEFENIQSTLDVTGGYSYQNFENRFPSHRSFRLTTDIFGLDNPDIGSNLEVNNSVLENRLISFFGRVNYAFKDRYLVTATVRRDGSSRFGPNNRWGWFPSAAVAWKISEEPFLNLGEFVNELKLRVGWGITGNQEIGDFQFLTTFQPSTPTARVQFGDDLITTIRPNGSDLNLQWEETQSLNIGLDYGLWKGRITGSLEFYLKRTDELLFTINIPAGSNLSNRILTNIGEIENRGIEFSINAIVFETEETSVEFGFNVARNSNEIIDLFGANEPNFLGIETGSITGGIGATIQRLNVGQPVNSFFVYEHIRDASGQPVNDVTDRNEDGVTNDLDIYVDQNGDGIINLNDRRQLEQPAPDWILGFTGSAFFKGFDLNFTMRASLGNYVYNNVASSNGFKNRVTDNVPGNAHASVLETDFVRIQPFSDVYIENASFLRMDNLSIGYTFQNSNNLRLRVFYTVQNLFTITDYSGLDPEIGNASNNVLNPRFGIDENIFPRARTSIVGLNFNF